MPSAYGFRFFRAASGIYTWLEHALRQEFDQVRLIATGREFILRGAEAVLIDFGAARLHKPEHEMDTQILGTTGFAAPEQYGLSQSDLRTDIYSVGILINVMLTGAHPSKNWQGE